MFGSVEASKLRLSIQEYSIAQTSLEQIFNQFAAQQDEERGPAAGIAIYWLWGKKWKILGDEKMEKESRMKRIYTNTEIRNNRNGYILCVEQLKPRLPNYYVRLEVTRLLITTTNKYIVNAFRLALNLW